VEAYVMGVPALSYRAVVNEEIDYGFYRLPNLVSRQCFSLDELIAVLKDVLTGNSRTLVSAERDELINCHLEATRGRMACERIVDVLESMIADNGGQPGTGPCRRLQGRLWATGRTLFKQFKSSLPGSHNKPEFQRHRFPEISLDDIQNRMDRFRKVTAFADEITVWPFGEHFFTVST
jgi:hypothetical protein